MLKMLSIAIIFVIIGAGTTFLYIRNSEKEPPTTKMDSATLKKDEKLIGFKSCKGEFPFISSELDCGSINERIDQVESLHGKIESYIKQQTEIGNADQVSVFFRDLNTRRWFGINENVNFYPASLAKLPFAMMMYKIAEIDKTFLDQTVLITKGDLLLDNEQHYQPAEMLEPEKSYPIDELLRRMLSYSDNAPTEKLTSLSNSLSTPILDDLGALAPPDTKNNIRQWNITAKSYANFFRILYNTSYLRPEYSNRILEQLSQSTFKNGLVDGVRDDVNVSHKFGEAIQTNPDTNEASVILHDCGIIYEKKSPYILCIMTQGKDLSRLEQIISGISRRVYSTSL